MNDNQENAQPKKPPVTRKKKKMDDNQENAQPKKLPVTMILLAVIVVLLGAGGFLGWNLLIKDENNGKENSTEASESVSNKKSESVSYKMEQTVGVICPLESFIVNLLDKSGSGKRYLKITIKLEVGNEKLSHMIKKSEVQLRDTIILLLSGQSFKEINSMEGKLRLKQSLLTKVNQILGGRIVRRLYFTEFVVQ